MRRPGHVQDYSAAELGEFPAVNSFPGPLIPRPSGIRPKQTFAGFVPRSAALAPHSDVLVPRLDGFVPASIADSEARGAGPVAPGLQEVQSSRQSERV